MHKLCEAAVKVHDTQVKKFLDRCYAAATHPMNELEQQLLTGMCGMFKPDVLMHSIPDQVHCLMDEFLQDD